MTAAKTNELDSAMGLEFRARAYPSIRVHDDPLGLGYWVVSAIFLEAGWTYELRLTLTTEVKRTTIQKHLQNLQGEF